ncbi:MAG: hypothetical protein CFE21_05745 [Bacteroidetes bacterium B1(2017)]|nr:MAG: hypothetical protein CFE21_05745 [Bacteroidetes bacterium B1(2017)]
MIKILKSALAIGFWPVHLFFFLVFSSVSILNHYYFRTAGLDYGIANQALNQYAHFEPAICTQLIEGKNMPYLGLHLSLWVPLLSPFYYIFGTYTLLLFQNLALIFCGIGIVKMGRLLKLSEGLNLAVLVQFYSSFAIYSALAFDYHDNVIGACFLPWIIYYYHKDQKLKTLLCFVAVLISKENMAIWMGFASISLWFTKKDSVKWFPASLLALSICWFLLAGILIMPALNPAGKFDQLSRYSHLGSSISGIIWHIVSHPWEMLKMFFQSHIQPDDYDGVKQEFLWVVLISGGVALLLKPTFLWMALPIFMQKLWNKELSFWGISYHYQIELAPIISVAILFLLVSVSQQKIRMGIAWVVTISTMVCTYSYMQSRKADYTPIKENIFSLEHYRAPFNVSLVQNKLSEVSKGSSICAQSNLLPHIAARKEMYHFPVNLSSSIFIVVFQPQFNSYPWPQDKANLYLDSLRQTKLYREDSSAFPLRILSLK